eukprot:9632075-Prorocentrum_lima.AAC.1
MMMTVLFADIHAQDRPVDRRYRVKGISAAEVLYADDTICVSESVTILNRQLSLIESEGAKYGLLLNKEKCELL